MDIRAFAENDDHAMHVNCGWATGNHVGDYDHWLNQFRVDELPQRVYNGIRRSEHSAQWWITDDDGCAATITDSATAEYGGGSVAMTWYADEIGHVYGIQDADNQFLIPPGRVYDVPQITDYQPIPDAEGWRRL